MDYQEYVTQLWPTYRSLADEFAAFNGLSDFLAWMQQTNRVVSY